MNSRLTFLLDHAKVAYKDAITGDSYDINDLNFKLQDVSPSSDMPFKMDAELDLLVQKRIEVTGPLVLEGDVKATSSGGAFEKATANVALKLDGLEINDPGLFERRRVFRSALSSPRTSARTPLPRRKSSFISLR